MFLPINKSDMQARGWAEYDFLLITGDAYVDHPSFGAAIISRVLENAGYRVCILAQPTSRQDYTRFGKPKIGVMITAGNIDSMVANYTVAKKRRNEDSYSPGGKNNFRPDRACIVYTRQIKELFPDCPVVLGGLEASLRRFRHYDYWSDSVRDSVLVESGADVILYGMADNSVIQAAKTLQNNGSFANIPGVCYMSGHKPKNCITLSGRTDKVNYAKDAKAIFKEQDPVTGKTIAEPYGAQFLIQTKPPMPLTQQEFDRVYALPYQRDYHPVYKDLGGVDAILEVAFSIIHNRGCFGSCNFCSLAYHQGRIVTCRSHDSVMEEAKKITQMPDFKGYIHDVGGPTANFRGPACKKQLTSGLCKDKQCLTPRPCKNMVIDHRDYSSLLKKIAGLPKVKKVFVRSGIRFDYLINDKNTAFLKQLVQDHISGQLKVAPEHCSDRVLFHMGKPNFEVYKKFANTYNQLNKQMGKKQFLVPYFISSHPGCTLNDAITLTQYLNSIGYMPLQVQDFYPTPGTLSTTMYYTGIDPRTMANVYVPKTKEEKAMQRALLQWRKPQNHALVRKALIECNRQDLIGMAKKCLIRR